MGYAVRLNHPRFVMPFVKGSGNDAVDAEASALATENFNALIVEFDALDIRITGIDRKLVGICRTNERCKRLATLPGLVPVIATALIAAFDDGDTSRQVGHSRHESVWFPDNIRRETSPDWAAWAHEITNICAVSSFMVLGPF